MDEIDIKNAISDVINELRVQTRIQNTFSDDMSAIRKRLVPKSKETDDETRQRKANTDSIHSNTKEQTQQTGAIRQNTKTQDSAAKKTGKLAATFDVLADVTDGLENSYRRMQHQVTGSSVQFGRSITGMIDSIVSGQHSFNNYSNVLGIGFKLVADGSGLFVRSLNASSRSLLVVSNVLSVAGSLVANITQRSMRMQDMLLDSYREISKSGGSASDGLSGISDSLRRMQLSVDELSVLNSIVASSRQEFAMMSGTVFTGRRRFAEISQILMQQREQFELLGLTVPEINESMASYIRLQTRLGITQNATNLELAQGASRYMKEMDALAKVTGIQRGEIESEIERARSEEIFRAKLQQLTTSGQTEIARNLELVNAVMAKEAPELAQGFRDIQSGIPTTQAAQQFLLATQHRGIGIIENMLSGNVGVAETLQELANVTKVTTNAYGPHLARFGKFGEIFGNYAQMLNFGLITGDEFVEKLRLSITELENQASGVDSETRTRLARERAVRDAQLEFNRVLRDATLPILNIFNRAIELLARNIIKITNFFSRFIPGVSPITEELPTLDSIETNLSGTQTSAQTTSTPTSTGRQHPSVTPTAPSSGAQMTHDERVQQLLDIISTAEGTHSARAMHSGFASGYDVPYGYGQYLMPEKPLSQMTIAEIKEFQRKQIGATRGKVPGTTMGTGAVGKYQITQTTLQGLQNNLGFTDDQLFDEQFQDYLANELLRGRGMERFMSGRLTREDFLNNLSAEWASIPRTSGVGTYRGQRTGVSQQNMLTALDALRGFRTGGISAGPNSGYLQLLHGTEAIVPLPDGNKIPVDIKGPSDSYASMNFSTPEETDLINEQKKINTGLGGLDALMREHIDVSKHQRSILTDLIDQTRKNTSAIEQLIRVTVN